MTRIMPRQVAASVFLLPSLVLGAGLAAGCSALDVSDPTRVEDTDLGNRTGAELARNNALHYLALALGDAALSSGVLADEFLWDPNPSAAVTWIDALDRRESVQYEQLHPFTSAYSRWHEVRRAAMVALPRLRTYMPEPPRSAYLGQMFAVRGFATLRLAEDICPGFPLHDMVDYKLVYGPPRTTAEAFGQALADFDSAVVYAADSTRFLQLARVGRARALLGLGRFAEAAAAVTLVPTSYVWNVEFSTSVGLFNPLVFTFSNSRYSVADREGRTGLDFVSAKDPRLTTDSLGMAYDGITGVYRIGKYRDASAPIVLANGIEARLIEAEAALRAADIPAWLAKLNEPRRTAISPAMADLTDPGTPAARIDLLFRERAFWLFATGHRLGDLRRLIAHYGRDPEAVFPAGPHRLGGLYGTGTSIPFPAALETPYNAAVTGCTSR